MTHEADTTNLSMSLRDDEAELAYMASIQKAKINNLSNRRDSYALAHKTDHELRMSFGRWSVQDKLEWQCMTCTFLNQPLFLSCEMCGQARPRQDSAGRPDGVTTAAALAVGTSVGIAGDEQIANETIISPEEQRDILMKEEEQRMKQERIKEIMALQQGIFNKIKEENEDELEDELEGSFAWMELQEEEAPVRERLKAGAAGDKGDYHHASKKPASDNHSQSTLTTVGTSYSNLSSQYSDYFSLDTSSNSQQSPVRTKASLGQNAAIPDSSLSSLKSDDHFRESLHKGAIRKNAASTGRVSGSGGASLVDFGALKAAIEGASVRNIDLDASTGSGTSRNRPSLATENSTQSFALDGESSHSIASQTMETPTSFHRRGNIASSVSSLQVVEECRKEALGEGGSPQDHATPASPRVGAMAMAVTPKEKSFKDVFEIEEEYHQKPKALPALSVEASSNHDTSSPGVPSTGVSDETDDAGDVSAPRARLHRLEGARKIKTPSLIPEERKVELLQSSDPVFSKNLYAERQRGAQGGLISRTCSSDKKKNRPESPTNTNRKADKTKSDGKSVHIPLLNRMLRKKKETSSSS